MLYFLGNTILFMLFLITLVAASATNASVEKKTFKISELKEALQQKVSQTLNRDDLSINNVSIRSDKTDKVFTISDISQSKIESGFSIASFNLNPSTKGFTANIEPQDGDYNIKASGKFTALQKLPVLSRAIKRGDIITQNDIELKFIDSEKVNATAITDITKIIGKAASRNLKKQSLITFNSINDPILVKRNKAVNAIYKIKNLEVKTVAIALQNGKEGDIIKLKNHESGKIFQAIVDDKGNVVTNIQGFQKDIAQNNTKNRNYN